MRRPADGAACDVVPRANRRARHAFLRCQEGLAAVEFALVAPILVLVLLGVMEFGIFAWNRHSLEFAVEETARSVMTKTAVTDGEVAADIKARVSGIPPESLATEVVQETVGVTKFVTLNISYTYNFFLLGNLVGLEPVVLHSKTRVPLRGE
jgi:Flp pilus assembly protein TadG